jgi:hypothetical protein
VAFGPAIWEVYQLTATIKTVVKNYGSNGNSFVAQLGNKSQITTCRGNSGNTQSKHFLIKPKCTKRSIQRRFILQRGYTEACRKIYHPGE